MGDGLCELFVDDSEFPHATDADDLFSILETWEDSALGAAAAFSPSCAGGSGGKAGAMRAVSTTNTRRRENDESDEDDGVMAPVQKKQKSVSAAGAATGEGTMKMSHITVERNRRKQMNEHLSVLRSLMPCFYVKRGDQASIIGGVVDYIKELQQVLQSLEAKKQRKVYTEQVFSPRPASSPRVPLSPRPLGKSPPPLSPRLTVPISPRTPTPGSPYKPKVPQAYVSPAVTPTHEPSPTSYLPSLDGIAAELAAHANKSATGLPDVKVEFSGANLVLKTVSHRIPGQALKIITAIESLSLEILHASISAVDDTMMNSFTIKIGIECELSVEELVQEIQQTFS